MNINILKENIVIAKEEKNQTNQVNNLLEEQHNDQEKNIKDLQMKQENLKTIQSNLQKIDEHSKKEKIRKPRKKLNEEKPNEEISIHHNQNNIVTTTNADFEDNAVKVNQENIDPSSKNNNTIINFTLETQEKPKKKTRVPRKKSPNEEQINYPSILNEIINEEGFENNKKLKNTDAGPEGKVQKTTEAPVADLHEVITANIQDPQDSQSPEKKQRKRKNKNDVSLEETLDCYICGAKYLSKTALVTHMRTKHPGDERATTLLNKKRGKSKKSNNENENSLDINKINSSSLLNLNLNSKPNINNNTGPFLNKVFSDTNKVLINSAASSKFPYMNMSNFPNYNQFPSNFHFDFLNNNFHNIPYNINSFPMTIINNNFNSSGSVINNNNSSKTENFININGNTSVEFGLNSLQFGGVGNYSNTTNFQSSNNSLNKQNSNKVIISNNAGIPEDLSNLPFSSNLVNSSSVKESFQNPNQDNNNNYIKIQEQTTLNSSSNHNTINNNNTLNPTGNSTNNIFLFSSNPTNQNQALPKSLASVQLTQGVLQTTPTVGLNNKINNNNLNSINNITNDDILMGLKLGIPNSQLHSNTSIVSNQDKINKFLNSILTENNSVANANNSISIAQAQQSNNNQNMKFNPVFLDFPLNTAKVYNNNPSNSSFTRISNINKNINNNSNQTQLNNDPQNNQQITLVNKDSLNNQLLSCEDLINQNSNHHNKHTNAIVDPTATGEDDEVNSISLEENSKSNCKSTEKMCISLSNQQKKKRTTLKGKSQEEREQLLLERQQKKTEEKLLKMKEREERKSKIKEERLEKKKKDKEELKKEKAERKRISNELLYSCLKKFTEYKSINNDNIKDIANQESFISPLNTESKKLSKVQCNNNNNNNIDKVKGNEIFISDINEINLYDKDNYNNTTTKNLQEKINKVSMDNQIDIVNSNAENAFIDQKNIFSDDNISKLGKAAALPPNNFLPLNSVNNINNNNHHNNNFLCIPSIENKQKTENQCFNFAISNTITFDIEGVPEDLLIKQTPKKRRRRRKKDPEITNLMNIENTDVIMSKSNYENLQTKTNSNENNNNGKTTNGQKKIFTKLTDKVDKTDKIIVPVTTIIENHIEKIQLPPKLRTFEYNKLFDMKIYDYFFNQADHKKRNYYKTAEKDKVNQVVLHQTKHIQGNPKEKKINNSMIINNNTSNILSSNIKTHTDNPSIIEKSTPSKQQNFVLNKNNNQDSANNIKNNDNNNILDDSDHKSLNPREKNNEALLDNNILVGTIFNKNYKIMSFLKYIITKDKNFDCFLRKMFKRKIFADLFKDNFKSGSSKPMSLVTEVIKKEDFEKFISYGFGGEQVVSSNNHRNPPKDKDNNKVNNNAFRNDADYNNNFLLQEQILEFKQVFLEHLLSYIKNYSSRRTSQTKNFYIIDYKEKISFEEFFCEDFKFRILSLSALFLSSLANKISAEFYARCLNYCVIIYFYWIKIAKIIFSFNNSNKQLQVQVQAQSQSITSNIAPNSVMNNQTEFKNSEKYSGDEFEVIKEVLSLNKDVFKQNSNEKENNEKYNKEANNRDNKEDLIREFVDDPVNNIKIHFIAHFPLFINTLFVKVLFKEDCFYLKSEEEVIEFIEYCHQLCIWLFENRFSDIEMTYDYEDTIFLDVNAQKNENNKSYKQLNSIKRKDEDEALLTNKISLQQRNACFNYPHPYDPSNFQVNTCELNKIHNNYFDSETQGNILLRKPNRDKGKIKLGKQENVNRKAKNQKIKKDSYNNSFKVDIENSDEDINNEINSDPYNRL